MLSKPKVIAIIVSFNRPDKVFFSINETLNNGADHIIIVDNSTDPMLKQKLNKFSKEKENISLLLNEDNLGASKAFQLGVELLPNICDLDNSIVVFLDDDAYLSSTFKDLQIDSKSFIAPLVTNKLNKRLKMNSPLIKIPKTLLDIMLYLFKRPVPNANKQSFIETASFVGLTMYARLAYENKGLIPDDFFIYYDDVYFTYKLTLNGYQGIFDPSLHVIHDTDDKKRSVSTLTLYYLFRNAVITYKLSSRWWGLIVALKYFRYLLDVCLFGTEKRIDKIKAMSNGVYDGLSRRKRNLNL